MRHLLIIFACVIPVSGFASQWEIAKEGLPDSSASEVPVAKSFVANACPTYRVDKRPPRLVHLQGETTCRMEAQRAHFSFGQQSAGKVRSTELHRLLNGTSIVFSYQLEEAGYAQSSFSLSRSKYAVRGVIGKGVEIVKE